MKLRGSTQDAMVTAVYAIRRWLDDEGTADEWEKVDSQLTKAIGSYEEDAARFEGSEQFDGATYNPALDEQRLRTLLGRVFNALAEGEWQTLARLVTEAGGTTASVSARIRDLRKSKHGGWIVDKRRIATKRSGTWEYRMRNPNGAEIPPLQVGS